MYRFKRVLGIKKSCSIRVNKFDNVIWCIFDEDMYKHGYHTRGEGDISSSVVIIDIGGLLYLW